MPAADGPTGKQEVDSRERGAGTTPIGGVDQACRTEDLPVVAALGMRFELEFRNELGGAWVHENGDIPHLVVTIVSESPGGALSK